MGFFSFGYDVSVGLCILCKALRCEICKLLCCEIHKMQFGELWSLRNIWFFLNKYLSGLTILLALNISANEVLSLSFFTREWQKDGDSRKVCVSKYLLSPKQLLRKTLFIRIFVGLKFANNFQVLQTLSTIRFRHRLRNKVYLFVNKMGSFHSNDSSDLSHYKVILDSPISLYFSQ